MRHIGTHEIFSTIYLKQDYTSSQTAVSKQFFNNKNCIDNN